MTPQPQPRSLPALAAIPEPLSAAEMLRAVADAGDGEYISLDEILTGLGNQGFGLLVLLLALPNAIPGPMIPFFSLPFALGIMLLSVQILQGHTRPLLPAWVRRRTIRRQRFRRFVESVDPLLRRFERWFRPRHARFLRGRRDRPRLLGLILMLFALVLAMSIPISNGPQAFAICIVALGMFEGDEKVETIGIAFGIAATLLNAAIVVAGVRIVDYVVALYG